MAIASEEVEPPVLALQYDRFGGPEVMEVGEAPEPHAGPGEVRVRVRAAGVTRADALLRAGLVRSSPPRGWPHIPGVDAAGVVDEVGPGALDVAVGNDVFGAVDLLGALGGASAEFAVLQHWASKPAAVGWAQAGAAATSVETAVRALDLLEVAAGTTLLIEGGAGAVGSTAAQLALARGARVLATASSRHHATLVELGVEPVTYGPGLRERLPGDATVDSVLDAAGAGTLPQLVELVGDPRQVATIADFTAPTLGVQFSYSAPGQASGWYDLENAARMMEAGTLRILVREILPLADGARAHAEVGTGHGMGKVVLQLPAS